MAALLSVSSLVPVAGGGLVYLVKRMMSGGAGVQERVQYEANLEKKFCRTETSASMKPMLGPVRCFRQLRLTDTDCVLSFHWLA